MYIRCLGELIYLYIDVAKFECSILKKKLKKSNYERYKVSHLHSVISGPNYGGKLYLIAILKNNNNKAKEYREIII